jgi:hypothetical protein
MEKRFCIVNQVKDLEMKGPFRIIRVDPRSDNMHPSKNYIKKIRQTEGKK